MPRPKGSKNKASKLPADERLVAIDAEIAELQKEIAKKKRERKKIIEQKNAEDQKKLLAAVQNSGMSIEDAIALLGGAKDEKNQ